MDCRPAKWLGDWPFHKIRCRCILRGWPERVWFERNGTAEISSIAPIPIVLPHLPRFLTRIA